MAVTGAGAQLTAAEQAATQRLGMTYAALALAVWRAQSSPEDVDASWLKILELLVPQVLKARRQAAGVSRSYYQAFRKLEVPREPLWTPPDELVELDRQVLETSLRVTGPVAYKQKLERLSGAEIDPATEKALLRKLHEEAGKQMAAAVIRHVAGGARDQIETDVKADPVALGFLRATKSADPCFFCALLASRGPVYKDNSFKASDSLFDGQGTAKAHDNCACVLEPVYTRDTKWPDIAREAERIYKGLKPKRGQSTLQAFRAAWDSR